MGYLVHGLREPIVRAVGDPHPQVLPDPATPQPAGRAATHRPPGPAVDRPRRRPAVVLRGPPVDRKGPALPAVRRDTAPIDRHLRDEPTPMVADRAPRGKRRELRAPPTAAAPISIRDRRRRVGEPLPDPRDQDPPAPSDRDRQNHGAAARTRAEKAAGRRLRPEAALPFRPEPPVLIARPPVARRAADHRQAVPWPAARRRGHRARTDVLPPAHRRPGVRPPRLALRPEDRRTISGSRPAARRPAARPPIDRRLPGPRRRARREERLRPIVVRARTGPPPVDRGRTVRPRVVPRPPARRRDEPRQHDRQQHDRQRADRPPVVLRSADRHRPGPRRTVAPTGPRPPATSRRYRPRLSLRHFVDGGVSPARVPRSSRRAPRNQ